MIFCYKNDFYYDYKEDFNKHLLFCEGTGNDSTPILNLYTGKTCKCKSYLLTYPLQQRLPNIQ